MEEQKILKRLRKAQESRNDEQIAFQYNKLGDLRMNQGQYDEALLAFKETLNFYKHSPGSTPIQIGCAHRMVGEAYVQLGNWDKALKHQQVFLSLAKKANDKVEQQRAWASIGRAQICIAENKGEEGDEQLRKEALSAARNALVKSLAIATTELNHLRKRDLCEMKARLMLNLGLVHEYQGQGDDALKKMQKAVDLCRDNELYEDLCRSLIAFGSLKHRQGDCAAALQDIEESLKVAKRLAAEEKPALIGDALTAQAEVFFTLGDFSAAKHVLLKAYKMKPTSVGIQETLEKNLKISVAILQAEKQLQDIDEDNYKERKVLYERIADCASELKAYSTAINYYKKMLECSEALGETGKNLSPALVSLALSYKDNKQYEESLYYFEKENELWQQNPKEACRSLQEIAAVYKLLGNGPEHIATLEKARMQALLSGNRNLQLDVLREIANYHRLKGNSKAADEVDNDILELRSNVSDSEGMSSQDISSSQEQGAAEIWESVNISDLSSDNSDVEEELQVKPTRLRMRNQCRVTKNEKGETGLHRACIAGKIDQVGKLLDSHHPVNIRDHAGWTPLHEAANHGYKDIVDLLLSHGANIDDKGGIDCDGVTPLHDAASNGCMDVMELLMARGADITAKTYTKPRKTAYDFFVSWHEENKPLDEDTELCYETLKNKMHQAMERAGFTFNETDNSERRLSNTSTTSALTIERPVVIDLSAQPSTSGQGDRKSYEHRAIVKMKKTNPLRILSSGASSQSDEDRPLRVGTLRRHSDARTISDQEEEKETTKREKRRQISSDSDDETPATQRRSVYDGRPAYNGQSAQEYADVMDTIRGKHRFQPKGSEPFVKRSKPALLHEEEIEPEWLEDDMGQTNQSQPIKRKRISSPVFSKPSQSKEPRIERSSIICTSRSPSPQYDDMDADIDDIPPISPPRRKASPIKRSPQKMSPKKSKIISPYKPSQRILEQEDLVTVKVRVEDVLLLVPVTSRKDTIATLATEVAQRYYRLKGLLPKLTLLTKDGALLSPEDPVTVIQNSKDEEVQARVDSMTLPPLIDRYKEACQQQNHREDSYLLTCLDSCQVTLILKLNNLHLGTQQDPLFHSLTRQHSLKELSLAGCALGDSGMEKLCSVLETLKSLSSIDLSCNNITPVGLTFLNDLVTNKKELQNLKSLDISNNPLEYEGLNLLCFILENLNCITKLSISNCDLNIPEDFSTDQLPMFTWDLLTELDISYNALGTSGLDYFFGKIDVWQVTYLNVACTTASFEENGSVAREVALLIQNMVQGDTPGGSISRLDISGCKLADVDVHELLRALTDTGMKVEHLVLSCNPDLTALCLRYLLQHEPIISSLTLTGCPRMLYPLQASELPVALTSFRISTTKINDIEIFTKAWTQAKGTSSAHRQGPGGLLQLSVI